MQESTAMRLNRIMHERNLRQIDVIKLAEPYCRQFGLKLTKSDMSQFLSGKVVPGQWKLSLLGKALNVSEAWLMGYDVPRERKAPSVSDASAIPDNKDIKKITTNKIPLLGNVACGEPIYANEEHDVYVDADSALKADFCLRAKGNSMIGARICDGDIVFIHSQEAVENGEIAAVLIVDEVVLKRVQYDRKANTISLYSENPLCETLHYKGHELDQIRILGKAVAFQGEIK